MHTSFQGKLQDHTRLVQRLACSHSLVPMYKLEMCWQLTFLDYQILRARVWQSLCGLHLFHYRTDIGIQKLTSEASVFVHRHRRYIARENVTSALSPGSPRQTGKLGLLSDWIELEALRRLCHDAVDIVEGTADSPSCRATAQTLRPGRAAGPWPSGRGRGGHAALPCFPSDMEPKAVPALHAGSFQSRLLSVRVQPCRWMDLGPCGLVCKG